MRDDDVREAAGLVRIEDHDRARIDPGKVRDVIALNALRQVPGNRIGADLVVSRGKTIHIEAVFQLHLRLRQFVEPRRLRDRDRGHQQEQCQ